MRRTSDSAVISRLKTPTGSGKHHPLFTPHVDIGDSIIVINAEKIALTGKKWDQKTYDRHSGYTGGITAITAKKLLEKRQEVVIRFAVKGMLPKKQTWQADAEKAESIFRK